MKTIALLVGFAVLVLAAAAAFAPAALLDARIDAATQGQLRLANAEGSVWHGRGLVTNAQRTWSVPIGWKIAPLAFARGELLVTLRDTGSGDSSRGDIAWRDGTLEAQGAVFTVPSSAIIGVLAAGNAVASGGTIAFDATHFSWSGNGGVGAATVRWSGARVASNAGIIALGTITANCTPRNGRIQGRVENHGGDVRIDGEFAWSGAGAEVNATLSALPSTPPEVVRALSTLGTADATGAVHVQWRSGPR